MWSAVFPIKYFSLPVLLSKLLGVMVGFSKRGTERLFTLLTYSDSTDLHSKAKEATTQISWVSGYETALHRGPRRHCAEWLVTTWIFLTHSPITVLLQWVVVSLPQAAHKSEFHWLPQRNRRMMALCNFKAANEFSGGDLMLTLCPYAHLDEADEHE